MVDTNTSSSPRRGGHEALLHSDACTDGPRVSVCMTVYNGGAFLMPQIESILGQRHRVNELVIVDDASQDESPAILRGIRDPRVQVHTNAHNMGILRAFERALSLASGSVVFLSDQDDVWFSHKVEDVLGVFSRNPRVTLVVTDATVIDETGALVSPSFYSTRGKFAGGIMHNLAKNKYLGCTMAFRRRMLKYFLPIPADVPMHDMWFGLLNDLYGSTSYIDQPLMAYRRHDGNASPATHASFRRMLFWRWCLVRNILGRMISHATSRQSGENFGA